MNKSRVRNLDFALSLQKMEVHFWRHHHFTNFFFFLPSSRLYVLQGGLAQQEWRVPELLHRLLKYLEPKLTQVYKNVRERIGRLVLRLYYVRCFSTFRYVILFICTPEIRIEKMVWLVWILSLRHETKLKVHSCVLCSVLTYIFMIDISLPNTALTKSPRVHDFTSRILEKLKPLMEVDEEIQNHVLEENGVGEEDERTQGIKLLKTSRCFKCVRT